jgi:hypothetical protein
MPGEDEDVKTEDVVTRSVELVEVITGEVV